MDFLAKHFEKIILAVCLVCLVWSIKAVSDHETQDEEKTKEAITKMTVEKVAKGDKLVERLDPESLPQLDEMLSAPLLRLNLESNGVRNAPALFDGGQYVICKNSKCGYAIPFSATQCPYCHVAQEEIAPEPQPTDDLDQDGIPDLDEKANPILNYRYPYDAMVDYDGDGFLNIEEFRAGTDMEDATRRPSLAYLLRRVGPAKHSDLPIVLKRVKAFDSDSSTWKASLSLNGSPRTSDYKAEAKIHGTEYTLVSIPSTSSIVIRAANGTEYTLTLNQTGKENAYSVEFVYLTSHVRGVQPANRSTEQMAEPAITEEDYAKMLNDQRNGMGGNAMMAGAGMPGGNGRMGAAGAMAGAGMPGGNGMMGGRDMSNGNANSNEQPLRFRLHVGDSFVLQKIFTLSEQDAATHPEAVGLFTEYYTVLDVTPATEEGGQDIVRVQQLTEKDGDPIGRPVEVPILDNTRPPLRPAAPASKDYFYTPGAGSMGGMGGMGGMM